jgi:hypothetical protein
MMQKGFAERFAREWVEAWNAHDLERVLSHYEDDFEMSSPIIVTMMGEPSGKLKGKAAVGAYWAKALKLLPQLRFELVAVLAGADSVVDVLPRAPWLVGRSPTLRQNRQGAGRVRALRRMVRLTPSLALLPIALASAGGAFAQAASRQHVAVVCTSAAGGPWTQKALGTLTRTQKSEREIVYNFKSANQAFEWRFVTSPQGNTTVSAPGS